MTDSEAERDTARREDLPPSPGHADPEAACTGAGLADARAAASEDAPATGGAISDPVAAFGELGKLRLQEPGRMFLLSGIDVGEPVTREYTTSITSSGEPGHFKRIDNGDGTTDLVHVDGLPDGEDGE